MAIEVRISVGSIWSGDNGIAGNATIFIKNPEEGPISGWSLKIKPDNFIIGSAWNLLKNDLSDGSIQLSGQTWNKDLSGGVEINSGFEFSGATGNSLNVILESGATISAELPGLTAPNPTIPVESGSIGIDGKIFAGNEPVASYIAANQAQSTGKKLFMYLPEWGIYAKKFGPEKFPANMCTHLMYAFMLPQLSQADYDKLKTGYNFPPNPYTAPSAGGLPEGSLTTHDRWAALEKVNNGIAGGNIGYLKHLKQLYPHLKVIISCFGWSLSITASKIAADSTLRARFVKSLGDFIVQHGFDGADIDWEFVGVQGPGYNYVDANDGANFVKLVADLRAYFDSVSPAKHLEITAATGINPAVLANYAGSAPYLDYLLLMTYDMKGQFDANLGHQSGFYRNPADTKLQEGFSVIEAIDNAKKVGFVPAQLAIGSPFYARHSIKADPNDFSAFGQGKTAGSQTLSGESGESGNSDYRHVLAAIESGELTEYYDDIAQAAYAHTSAGSSSVSTYYTYDNPQSVRYKANYVVENGFAGMLCWEVSTDHRDYNSSKSLLWNIVDVFGSAESSGGTSGDSSNTGDNANNDSNDANNDTTSGETADNNTNPVKTDIFVQFDGLTVTVCNESGADFVLKPGEKIKLISKIN